MLPRRYISRKRARKLRKRGEDIRWSHKEQSYYWFKWIIKLISVIWIIAFIGAYSGQVNALEIGINAGVCGDTGLYTACDEGIITHVYVGHDVEVRKHLYFNAQAHHFSHPEKNDLSGRKGTGSINTLTFGFKWKF